MTRRLLALLLVMTAFALPSGAGERLPGVVQRALDAPSRRSAVTLLEAEIPGTTDPAVLPWLRLYAGEMRRLAGELPEARAHFEVVAADWPSSPARQPAVLGMAVVDAGGTAGGNVLATLGLIPDANVPDTLNADRYLLLADARAAQGAPADEVATLARKARAYAATDREVARRIAKATESWLVAANNTVAEDPAANAAPGDLGAIQRIRAALAAGRFEDAARDAAQFPATFPDSPFVKEAEYAVRRAQKRVVSDRRKVAVLLPLTGDYALPAANLKAAIELANREAATPATLVFHDTAGKPEQCVKVLETAVLEQGASVVIGPLRKEEALVCGPAAQALQVPMLTLSSSAELVAVGPLLFRPFPSAEEQVAALLDEVMDRRGMRSFAVLHPRTSYGSGAAAAFQAEVTRRGGEVLQVVGYDPASTDFRSSAKALGGKDYKARAAEYASLKAQAAARGGDPSKVVLPPEVAFEAIFIPDSYQRVALVASALAFEEFPVGAFRPRAGDAPITLLGLNAWNNDELARRGGKYVIGSVFVDAFDVRSSDAATARFKDRWGGVSDTEPSVVEAVGYDTMLLVNAALAQDGDLASALAGVRIEDGIAGTSGFAADRHAVRAWRVLTVSSSGVVPLGNDPRPTGSDPAPE